MTPDRAGLWKFLRGLLLPLLVAGFLGVLLWQPVRDWLATEENYDEAILQEWLTEARGFRDTLPNMVDAYLVRSSRYKALVRESQQTPNDLELPWKRFEAEQEMVIERDKVREHLEGLGTPPTRMFPGQLPLFPTIYHLAVQFDDPDEPPIVWDSRLPQHPSQYREMVYRIHPRARVVLRYQLHAYNKRQRDEEQKRARQRRLLLVAGLGLAALGGWFVLVQRRERRRERLQILSRYQLELAERERVQHELLRKEAEQRQEEAERRLLEQQLTAQVAERKLLEMRSQLYASIGIMAGSYAHNIKNLLVRPNDLLRRCLDGDGLAPEQSQMLQEVRQTLGTVTERLQQILRTVQRDPANSELTLIDLGDVLREIDHTWREMAWDKWKLQLTVEQPTGPLLVQADRSHILQVVENLLFNARDATFEMRNHLRDQARSADLDSVGRRQALIGAAAWKGQVRIVARGDGETVVLEVSDNGVGMTEEVRRRCTETHFSTKRDNANYEGHSTGMGLGLSFVEAILEHHGTRLEITSAPLKGATFTVRFRAAPT